MMCRAWFGWIFNLREAGLVLALGGISGILGHTLANYSLKHLPSLLVSVGLLFEPVIGSIIGWLFDKQREPDLWTYIGGAITLAGAALVVTGSSGSEDQSNETLPSGDPNAEHSGDCHSQSIFEVEGEGGEASREHKSLA
eukprot:gb/GECG01004242.1/.p1 GENE.gb/GECG01004242.1/~~gb/GECG01004242.1/.p1  ORF type:complete len:140 (+),score=9.91 gb/GECG01004242.1/:1-420(+)